MPGKVEQDRDQKSNGKLQEENRIFKPTKAKERGKGDLNELREELDFQSLV